MRIEEINNSKLSKAPKEELYSLRLRFIQLWSKNFQGNQKQTVGELNRSDFLDKYRLLVSEMGKRNLTHSVSDIDRAAFRKAVWGLDISSFGDVVIVHDYIAIGGSFVKSPVSAEDIDIIICDDEHNRDEGLELKLSRVIQEQAKKDCHFIYAPAGPHSSYIPLFDKVLRSKEDMQVVEVKEDIVDIILDKAGKLKLTLVGTGALESPRKDECLLVEFGKEKVLIDAGPDIKAKDLPKLTGLLVCDPESGFMKDAKRIGQHFGLIPQVKKFDKDGLRIEPFEVKHTKHKTYAYIIKAEGKTIVYAPEFFVFPKKQISKADLAICEGSTWSRPIVFTGKVGGHAAVLDTYKKCKALGIPVIFTHIGKPTEKNLDKAKEMGIEIGKDGQKITSFGKAKKLTVGKPFTPLKTAGGYGKLEFGDAEALWKFWAKGYIPEPGIAVETKYDGYRVTVHKSDSVKIFSEDAKRDLSERLPELANEIKAIKENCILDGELLLYKGDGKIARKDMTTYLTPKYEGRFTAKIACFDCLWYSNEDLHEKAWTERQEYFDKLFGGLDEKFLFRVKPTIAKTEAAFKAAIKKHSGEEDSEGAMLKSVSSKYPLTGSTSAWAKFKNIKEIRVRVVDKTAKKGGGWLYDCEIADNTPIGRTYATSIEAKKGDVLEVVVTEVKYDEETKKFTWDNPIVRSLKPKGTALTTVSQAKSFAAVGRARKSQHRRDECMESGCSAPPDVECLWAEGIGHAWFCEKDFKYWATKGDGKDDIVAVKRVQDGKAAKKWSDNNNPNIIDDFKLEKGNIDFKEDDKGTGILQLHIMGIEEEKIEKLDKDAIFAARHDLKKLKSILKNNIGEQGAHFDIRLLRTDDEAWRGGEIHIGNISGLSKIYNYKQGDKLRANWKSPHVSETKDEEAVVTGGMSWFKAGERSVEVFKPGEPGATAKKYAIMLQVDKYKFKCEQQDKHAKKFQFTSKTKTKFFDGRWLFAYVPVAEGRRVWMASKLKEEEEKIFEKYVPIFSISKKEDEHIVCGIVYEPNTVDSEGDKAAAAEIKKAAYQFMEEVQRFKVNHQGEEVKVKVLESYIAPVDFTIESQQIKKGSWLLTTRILDEHIWEQIKNRELTGYSMAGWARTKET